MITISVFGGADAPTVGELESRARAAATEGFDAIWFGQGFTVDTLTALAAASGRVPDIGLGTAVVPIQGRHPLPLAQQALTVAEAAGPGRFTLGVGVTHRVVSEHCYGVPYSSVLGLCAEELEALASLLGEGRSADLAGERIVARGALGIDGPSPGLVLAALGPKMLELAGRFTDGTVTWMTGVATIRRQVAPSIAAAASRADRGAPRVIVGLPVCVSDDRDGARRRVGAAMAGAARMPSYQRMLATEGVAEPVDVALVGDEDEVAGRIADLGEAGATELLANVQGDPGEQARTRTFLGRLARA
ncbi:MAG TPA: TIGR03564 family F420-dependent LLM class oxidoreductase [Acidimicrobiales bacterium]|jgi:F420-dependent oxidoreductase-like protein|nr:TIGR03564 family F420-dependent LLM class oxidoreductase [Acidimicrobiales bacterium]